VRTPATLSAREAVRQRERAGFTLIEVMIALGILGFGLLALAAMQIEAMGQGSKGRHSADAAAVARSHAEQVLRLPWAVLTAAAGAGWTAPGWAGAAASVDASVDQPGGAGPAVEHSYGVAWRVTDVSGNACLRDVEVRVSWAEEDFAAARTLDVATRRYNWGDPSC
jgi:prepilin-type N-terminal cleavage/methylation domain-containing protein